MIDGRCALAILSFLHSWLWMEVDKLREITHIQLFFFFSSLLLALFLIASCLSFSTNFFSWGSITFSSGNFKILISVTKVTWLLPKSLLIFLAKGRERLYLAAIRNFLRLFIKSWSGIVIPLWSLFEHMTSRFTAVVSPLVRLRFTRYYDQEIQKGDWNVMVLVSTLCCNVY